MININGEYSWYFFMHYWELYSNCNYYLLKNVTARDTETFYTTFVLTSIVILSKIAAENSYMLSFLRQGIILEIMGEEKNC